MHDGLSAIAEDLLPAADAAPRCTDHEVSLAIDPGGSALSADLLLVIDLPRPWPAKIGRHELLAGRGPDLETAAGTARVIGVVPPHTEPRPIRALWRQGAELAGVELSPEHPDRVLDELATVHPRDSTSAIGALDTSLPTVLICAHGQRDQCCGSDGTRLVGAVREALPDVTVECSSHLGGHRFAPTLLSLPDGRMWAHADLDLVRRVVRRDDDPADLVPRCRGWWGATMGPAQMAERAVFARDGWALDRTDRTIAVDEISPGRWRCGVTADGHETGIGVEARRRVPVITCRSEGGQPTKESTEYRMSSP